jgi:hypothetical protein
MALFQPLACGNLTQVKCFYERAYCVMRRNKYLECVKVNSVVDTAGMPIFPLPLMGLTLHLAPGVCVMT